MEIWDFDYDLNNIWIYSDSDKALFCVETHSCQIDLLKVLEKKISNSFRGITYCNKKIYLAPQNGANEILIYDIEMQTIQRKSISEYYCPIGSQHNLFIEIVRYDNKIFLIPGRYKAIICLKLDTGEMFNIDGWYIDIQNDLSPNDNDYVIFNGVTRIDENRILINGWKSNVSLVFDMKEMSYQIIRYEDIGRGLRGAIYNEKASLIAYKDIEGIYLHHDYTIGKIGNLHGRLYSYKSKVFVVNSSLGKIYKFNNLDINNFMIVYSDTEKNNDTFFLVKQYFNKLIILNSNKDRFIMLDMETDFVSSVDISRLESFSVRIKSDECDGILFENEQLKLKKFVAAL